jgi:hypothetical protein
MSLRGDTISEPDRGDLVIVLPDAHASLAEASAYRQRGEPLFSYEPRPAIPQWLYAVFGGLAPSYAGCYHDDARPCQSFVSVFKS